MVYFPDAKVVMVSDQMTDNAPIVDFANGGSAVGWAPILDGVLKLDFEMAIPGTRRAEDARGRRGVSDEVRDASSPARRRDQGRRDARYAGHAGQDR